MSWFDIIAVMTQRELPSPHIRQPLDQAPRYNPYDVPADVLSLMLHGSETDPTALVYSGGASSRSIFDYLVEECGPHAEELAAYGFTTISISGTAFPVEVISDRAKLKAWYEKDYAAKHPEDKTKKEDIEGDSETVFERISAILAQRVPPGGQLEYEEEEIGESKGTFTDDHNEFSGRVTVRMRIVWGGDQEDTVIQLGKLKSTNSYYDSQSSSMEPGSYTYKINPKKVEGWIK